MGDTFLDNLESLDISALTKKDTTQANQVKKDLSTNASGALAFPIGEQEIPESIESTEPVEQKKKSNTQRTLESKQEEPKEEKSPIKLLAQFLKEQKLINFEDKDFKDEDNFLSDQLKKTRDTDIHDYKESLPEAIKFLIENYEDGVPLGALLQKEQLEFEYSNIDKSKITESPVLQQSLITDYLTKTDWTKEEIVEQLKEMEDAGTLEKNATRSLSKLIQIESNEKQSLIQESKQRKQDQDKLRTKQIEDLRNTITNTKEFIENIPTTDVEKKLVFDAIVKQDKYGRNKIDEFLATPKNYINLAYIVNVLKGDFSKLKTIAKTDAINSLRDTIDTKPVSKFSKLNYDTLEKYLNSTKIN